MRYAIAIVNYNCPRFLDPQIKRLRKYVRLNEGDTLDIIVGDNSRGKKARYKNQQTCERNSAIYLRFHFDEGDYSSHHALALNQIVNSYKNNFNSMLVIDHDIFPFEETDILHRGNNFDFMGLAQNKIGRVYLHPGIMVLNLDLVSKHEFNFLPCEGMDTGGRMADVIESSNIGFLGLEYVNYSVNDIVDFYEVIDKSWMHFVKGSNWNRNSNHLPRIAYLREELERKSK